jgi:hypothetical protein
MTMVRSELIVQDTRANGRIRKIKFKDLNIPTTTEADLGMLKELVQGAKRITIGVQNRHATLPARLFAYTSLLETPSDTHDAAEWDLDQYDPDDNVDYCEVSAGAFKKFTILGPVDWVKLRGFGVGGAIASDVDGYLEILYP